MILFIYHASLNGYLFNPLLTAPHHDQRYQSSANPIEHGTLGALLLNMGYKDDTYVLDAEGMPKFTDKILADESGLSAKEMVGKFSPAQTSFPFLFMKAHVMSIDDDSIREAKTEYIIPFLEKSNEYILPGTLSFSTTDDSKVKSILSNVQTYEDEAIMGFITGTKNINEWDEYVTTIKEMDIESAINIYQKAYDSWLSRGE